MFTSILTDLTNGLSITQGAICCVVAIVCGLAIAFSYQKQGNYTKNFTVTLALMPLLVMFVIMMVNGNLGTSVAILGAFGLVRFRSVPGSSREISAIFFSMAVGLAVGMGFITFALVITLIGALLSGILMVSPLGEQDYTKKELKVVIPEDLDYTEIFDDIFAEYLKSVELVKVKTIQLGSMIEITYHIELLQLKEEKKLIDAIRTRNGNLSIVCAKRQAMIDEL